MKPAWRLRTHLWALLCVTMLVTFTVVAVAAMVWRAPEMERQSRVELEGEVSDVTATLELLLTARRAQMVMLASLLHELPTDRAAVILQDTVARSHASHAIYLVSPQGRIEAAGLPAAFETQREDMLGNDLSANTLFRAIEAGGTSVWSGKYLSILTGAASVGLAYRVQGGRVLIGEVPLSSLLRTLRVAAGRNASSIWVLDRAGEILADTDGGRHVGRLNIRNWPLMQDLLHGRAISPQTRFEQRRFQTVATHAQALDWFVVGHVPAGLDYPPTRRLLAQVVATSLGSLMIGLLVTPICAHAMARPLQQIVARAARAAHATAGQGAEPSWPRGAVAEFNSLSADLETMATELQEREHKALVIFNASPVPMSVVDAADAYRLLDVNEAWCRQLLHRREDVVGRSAVDIGLWSEQARMDMLTRMRDGPAGGHANMHAQLVLGDGRTMRAQVFVRRVVLPTQDLVMWAMVDTEPERRIEAELRELNQLLEARVEQRTHALTAANDALSTTVTQVREAQEELVRAGKMAALGGLVAGVAHELNTPLGNGVMAVSAMADATRSFSLAVQGGLKRADLQRLVDSVEQGVDIAGRNLRRAAELIHSFKQVAVDQTSAQRRRFELCEVVHEMVVSLRPSFSTTPYRIETDVPTAGLQLDSYPGALGQTIANLVQNAMLHGFEGRDHGTVRILAAKAETGCIVLRVSDDGRGIAAEHLGRVFDPFMTTKLGRGGSGLGLHISYNAVVNLLGGHLSVSSIEGQGACFELRLPAVAPSHAPEAPERGDSSGEELWL